MLSDLHKLPKLLVLLGPTTAGKTEWGLQLAKKFNGEIICADSRQIYKKMNVGTAKIPGEWRRNGLRRTYFVEDVPHHLVDCIDPGKKFSAAEFRDKAVKYAKLAYQNERVPIVAGGTGLYIQALVDNLKIPRIPPNYKMRNSFETKTADELLTLLKFMDPESAKTVDPYNKRRIVRALEVCIMSGERFSEQKGKGEPLFDVLQIGIQVDRDLLHERIDERVTSMIERGLLEEIKSLLKQKYSWELPSMSGIGYRQFKGYFEGAHTLDDAVQLLKRDTRRYARRQMVWFKRDSRIKWCRDYAEAEKLAEDFLTESN